MGRFKPYLLKRALKKYRFLIFVGFLFLIFLFLLFSKIGDINKKSLANNLNKFFLKTDFSSCEKIINLDKDYIDKNNYINKELYQKAKQNCFVKYDISNISFSKDVCSLIVNTQKKQDLFKYFLKLDDFEKVKNECISKYLNLKFSSEKGLNKEILFDIKYPKNIRYKDKIFIDFSIFNNENKKENINIKYKSNLLNLTGSIDLEVKPKSLKNYNLEIENNKKSGVLDLQIDFLKNQKIIETKTIKINILTSPNIGFREYKYGKTFYKNPFISLDFLIDKKIDRQNSTVKLEVYNNSLLKIKDIYLSLDKYKIENSFYNLALINSILELLKLKDSDLEKIGLNKEKLKSKINDLLKNFKNYQIKETGMFSLRKNTNVADFPLTAYIYVTLKKLNSNLYDLENTKKNLYYYISDETISLSNRLEVMMILSKVDSNIDLRFINHNNVKSKHDLITYTYALFNTGPVVNDDLIKINIIKIKNLLKTESKKYLYYSNFSDELLFLNFLVNYDYKDKNYLLTLFDDIYKFDFERIQVSFLDKYLSIQVLVKKYLSYENSDKTKFGFMLGLARNTNKVFWIGGMLKPFDIFNYNLDDLLAYGDTKLEFYTKKLLGKDFKVNLVLNGEYKNLADNVKNNKNVKIIREIYKKNKDSKEFELYNGTLEYGEQYKIIDKIIFIDQRPRKNIIIKDFLPSSFEFLQILGEDHKYNSFSKNNNYLEFQFANYWGRTIELSYLIKIKYKGEFLDPGIRVFKMFDYDVYGESKNQIIKVK